MKKILILAVCLIGLSGCYVDIVWVDPEQNDYQKKQTKSTRLERGDDDVYAIYKGSKELTRKEVTEKINECENMGLSAEKLTIPSGRVLLGVYVVDVICY